MSKILYNVTVSLEPEIHDEWLQWMREKHIPEVLATGCFLENRMLRILNEEDNGITYAMQYLAPSMEQYQRYIHEHAPALRGDAEARFANKFAAFRTVLTLVDHQIVGS
ncbi:MAG TPA: DUF4286 family protein [Luteibaculaceae bacterium]|nr:DUF4286 family protein [Luteibaculaceae bacterium]